MTLNKWQQRRAQSAPSSSKVLTARMFLGKDGFTPYITPEELFHFVDHGREEDNQEMSAFFGLVKARHTIIVTRRIRKDKGDTPYKYQNFNRNGNPDGVKVVRVGRIFDFIEDLYDRKFVIDFTYDDLIEEAEQV